MLMFYTLSQCNIYFLILIVLLGDILRTQCGGQSHEDVKESDNDIPHFHAFNRQTDSRDQLVHVGEKSALL